MASTAAITSREFNASGKISQGANGTICVARMSLRSVRGFVTGLADARSGSSGRRTGAGHCGPQLAALDGVTMAVLLFNS